MNTQKPYVYVIIRRDISPEQQAVQIGHAALEAGRALYAVDEPIASLIVLEVADKAGLLAAAERLKRYDIAFELFFEPDFGMGESALATRPVRGKERHLFKAWQLYRRAEPAVTPVVTPHAPATA
ncbi:hypothetical protein [Burkholderia cenocepacia]|uniref:hypothetical protein n=1 Tax=Burkholderia cenocepacia TaxID=95486 RepID=UPI000760FAE9|nr:hypothetical protein [Burkholderia cenocepacia]KWU24719.1 hypothetical protein AS149_31735 [Burkholderia cenocepacia]